MLGTLSSRRPAAWATGASADMTKTGIDGIGKKD
jgi:hypothetical protein